MHLLILTVIVHLNNVSLTFTPTSMIWFPRHFATVATLPAPNGCRVNLCFPPSSCSGSVSLCYVDPICNLIFAPPRIFYGYKLLECYLSPKSLTKGIVFPFTNTVSLAKSLVSISTCISACANPHWLGGSTL
jgi:hypothetical protein